MKHNISKKNHTICVNKKGVNSFYVIWIKMIDLRKGSVHRNLCHVAMKKTKSYCNIKHPTKEQLNTKE